MGRSEMNYLQILEQVGNKFTSATGQSISFIDRGGKWQSALNLDSFTPFCRCVISTAKGRALCCECNNAFAKTDHGTIDIGQCHMGVSLVSVPVKQENNDLLISYGQFLLEETRASFFSSLPENCRKLGLCAEELRPLADHLRVFTRAELNDKIELLKLFSNYVNVMENERQARREYYREYQEKLSIENKLSALEFDSLNAQVTPAFIAESISAIASAAYKEGAAQTAGLLQDLLYILQKSAAFQESKIDTDEKMIFAEEFKRFQWSISPFGTPPSDAVKSCEDNNRLAYKACAIIKARYGEALTLESVAGELHISPIYLSRIFKRETGGNFKEYLIRVRMSEAQRLLRQGTLTVGEIAGKVGYEDASYFSRAYKKQFGYTPKAKNF